MQVADAGGGSVVATSSDDSGHTVPAATFSDTGKNVQSNPPQTGLSGYSQTRLSTAPTASPPTASVPSASTSVSTTAAASSSQFSASTTSSSASQAASAVAPFLPPHSTLPSAVSPPPPAAARASSVGRPRPSPTSSPLAAAALAEVDNLSLHFTSLTQHKLSQPTASPHPLNTLNAAIPSSASAPSSSTASTTPHRPAHTSHRPLLPALTSSTQPTAASSSQPTEKLTWKQQQRRAEREGKRRAKQEAAQKRQQDKHSVRHQQQRDSERQQRRLLLPVLLAHEQEEEQRLLQAIQHKWKKLEAKYNGDAEDVKPIVRRVSVGAAGDGTGGGSGGYSGGGMYSPSSPFYFTHFSSYAHHASRVGPRYQSDIQPLLTQLERNSAAEASRFPEHSTPLSSPAAFTSLAASLAYNQRHFSSPPSFPAFSHVLSALTSPQQLAYRREQWLVRERVAEEKRFGSVRVGGRGRRSTRITPGIGAVEGGGEKRRREPARREERGVDSVPVVWERMLNDRGEPMGGGGRERIERLIANIAQWRRQQRTERQSVNSSTSTATNVIHTAPSSLSALPPPVTRTTPPTGAADKSERTEGPHRGRETEATAGGGVGGSNGVSGRQQTVSSLATLPLSKDKDDRVLTSKRKGEAAADSDGRRKRSRVTIAAQPAHKV